MHGKCPFIRRANGLRFPPPSILTQGSLKRRRDSIEAQLPAAISDQIVTIGFQTLVTRVGYCPFMIVDRREAARTCGKIVKQTFHLIAFGASAARFAKQVKKHAERLSAITGVNLPWPRHEVPCNGQSFFPWTDHYFEGQI